MLFILSAVVAIVKRLALAAVVGVGFVSLVQAGHWLIGLVGVLLVVVQVVRR